MLTITTVSQKGGSGKTTTAINLAVAGHLKGLTALVVDLDLQASATAWHKVRADKLPHVQPTHPAALQSVLDAARASVDLAIIDTAAKTESDTVLAVEAADLVVIPCRPSAMDLRAIMNTVRLCRTRDIKPHVVLTQVEPQGTAAEETRDTLKKLGIDALPISIGRRQAFVHSINDGRGVAEYEPRGKAAQEMNSLLEFLLAHAKKRARKQASKQASAVNP